MSFWTNSSLAMSNNVYFLKQFMIYIMKLLEGGREFLEPHLKRISMSNKITRHFKIGTLHRIAIYLSASQKTNSLKTERPTTEGHRNDRNRVTHYSEGTTYNTHVLLAMKHLPVTSLITLPNKNMSFFFHHYENFVHLGPI